MDKGTGEGREWGVEEGRDLEGGRWWWGGVEYNVIIKFFIDF